VFLDPKLIEFLKTRKTKKPETQETSKEAEMETDIPIPNKSTAIKGTHLNKIKKIIIK